MYNTNNSKGLVHLSRLTPVTKVTNMNGTSDVSGVDEGHVVAKIRRRLQKIRVHTVQLVLELHLSIHWLHNNTNWIIRMKQYFKANSCERK